MPDQVWKVQKPNSLDWGWHDNHMGHHHPQLLTIKECSSKKSANGKKVWMIPLTNQAQKIDQVDSKKKDMG